MYKRRDLPRDRTSVRIRLGVRVKLIWLGRNDREVTVGSRPFVPPPQGLPDSVPFALRLRVRARQRLEALGAIGLYA